uniref:Fibronectin type-III domain-containing protein n=1 Tax=Neogobius melanostomus TaxID=47308 RepID=A0A8C6UTH7_9GOBI
MPALMCVFAVPGLQFGCLKSNVTLACGKHQTPVVWHFNHSSALPWHQVTSNGSLILLQTDHSAQGDYSCYDHQGLLVHSLTLRLGYPPGPLSISCRVPNHKHVRCSWADSVDTYLPAVYNDEDSWRPCVVDASGKHCDIDQPGFWQTTHILRVTETNALGDQTTLLLFKLYDLLKPDPPEYVTVDALEGHPTRLQVSWSFPSSWPQGIAFPLIFHIRYRPQESSYWSEVLSEESPLVIFDALAGHVHQVEVRAQDEVNQESHWSEWTDFASHLYVGICNSTQMPQGSEETSRGKIDHEFVHSYVVAWGCHTIPCPFHAGKLVWSRSNWSSLNGHRFVSEINQLAISGRDDSCSPTHNI